MVTKRKTRTLSIQKAATIRQVGEMAGVSIATVSRVFAGSDLVSHELVERVQEAARALNYQPNRIARNLRTQKTHTAAVMVSDIENPFFTSVIRGAERVLRNAGYTLLLTNSDEDEKIELEYLLMFDYVIVNAENCLGETVDTIEDIIRAEHHRTHPRKITL